MQLFDVTAWRSISAHPSGSPRRVVDKKLFQGEIIRPPRMLASWRGLSVTSLLDTLDHGPSDDALEQFSRFLNEHNKNTRTSRSHGVIFETPLTRSNGPIICIESSSSYEETEPRTPLQQLPPSRTRSGSSEAEALDPASGRFELPADTKFCRVGSGLARRMSSRRTMTKNSFEHHASPASSELNPPSSCPVRRLLGVLAHWNEEVPIFVEHPGACVTRYVPFRIRRGELDIEALDADEAKRLNVLPLIPLAILIDSYTSLEAIQARLANLEAHGGFIETGVILVHVGPSLESGEMEKRKQHFIQKMGLDSKCIVFSADSVERFGKLDHAIAHVLVGMTLRLAGFV